MLYRPTLHWPGMGFGREKYDLLNLCWELRHHSREIKMEKLFVES